MAIYRGKSEGHGARRMFAAEMDTQMQARRRLELDLRALRTGEIELFYQPLIDLQRRRSPASRHCSAGGTRPGAGPT